VIAEQARAIEELSAANARLAERVAQLERMASRNSGNSSMPPSSDELPGKTKPALKPVKGSGRARGKQQGAPGSWLAWVGSPDEWVAHRPGGHCGCGADLAGAVDGGIERSHQEHDLPEIGLRVRQHDVYRVRCRCGREHLGTLPAGVSPAPVSYGASLKSLVVYLLVYQHVPIERCGELISDLAGGAGPSSGFVHGMLTRCASAVRPVVTRIKELITRAPVVGFDETTLRAGVAGHKRDVLSASTAEFSLYHLGAGIWPRSPRSGSCRSLPGPPCTTATRTTTTSRGPSWPATKPVALTYCGTSPTPRSPIPARTGPNKPHAPCVA
jgi:transposase